MKDLNLLYVFEALWRDRSVTIAAESLGLSQAAVSSSLKRMRQEYGDPVFTLVGRRMEPTPLAESMSARLLDALSMVRKTDERTQFDPDQSKRLFTIRTRDIGEVICLPAVFSALQAQHPGIRLRTVFRPMTDTLTGMSSGQIDLALGFLPSLENGIHRRRLFEQHYVCVMRSGHPLAKNTLTQQRFCASDHLVVEYSGSGHQILEKSLTEAGIRHRIRIRIPQYLSAPHFICTSDLIWSVPAALAQVMAKSYPLVIKPHPLKLPPFEIALYWHDRFHRDPANKWMREFISEQLSGV
ncbi:LysR family transcriptional regulator [Xanthomonas arboricola]|uniref:LysR family transcriptional regulator n=1 Tax=Xanthomonas arboricola TaxID=56448 RepID=UPI00061A2563|nr:LysR family transcriptional regulator [Xanthomonas arboricola]AKC80634.1 LysR family transcriptional regulator [Xanthomonas arboricola]